MRNCTTSYYVLFLAANFNRDCDYSVRGCEYTVFVEFQGSTRLLSFTRVSCSNRAQALSGIITGSLVAVIIVLGILLLIILKIRLVVCVSACEVGNTLVGRGIGL